MTALIWMLTWLPQVLTTMSELPQPVNLTLTSSHFTHVLKWQPGPGTPSGVYFNVTINTEKGTSWTPVAGCKRVQYPLVCNLTDAFHDPSEVYFVRVVARKEAQTSKPVTHPAFKPITDAQLDMPLLSVTSCGSDLCVDLNPPMEQLREVYGTLHYKLKIQRSGADGATFFKDIQSLRRQVLQELTPGREYCVSVRISLNLESKEFNYSQPVCAATPGNHSADRWLSAVFCVFLMFIVIIVVLLLIICFIILRRRPLPLVLSSILHSEETLVVLPWSVSLLSLLSVKPTLPSAGEKRSNPCPDESETESETDDSDGARDYKLQAETNLVSSSSSSSSLSAPFPSEPDPQLKISSNQSPDFSLQSSGGVKQTMNSHTHNDSVTIALIVSDKQEMEVDSQDVNLLTLTFAIHEEEEAEPPLHLTDIECHSAEEEFTPTPNQPSQTLDSKEVAVESVSLSADEEEEESGYMGRPCTYVLKNVL
ncbi:interferon alpha/beta receptor 2-like [Solea solea]|uniref:interferon alpha/beta receptor 2-like n=1 Tax=Solea solea TaxID=90069 RepID=UPI00272BDD92|nr:interferon alpha/beta receptor 2-like [Solea solea]XP_058476380.1 interferon alpha/beta receptor 2-like [Solea solea]